MDNVVRSRKAVFYTILDGVMSTAVLLIAIFVITGYRQGEFEGFYFLILFLAAAAEKTVQALLKREKKEKKVIRLFISAGIYLLSAFFFFLTDGSMKKMRFLVVFLFVDLIIGRAFALAECKKWRSRIANILTGMLWTYFAIYCLLVDNEEEISGLIMILLGYICLQCLFHIIAMSFSQIKLKILMKIIRRTYALEILFGLGMLIISFSYILQYFDRETFHSFSDGLWYCFAVVTTIGFGDLVAVSFAGRLLSVILGIYGIIVVSLITSIIINFYSEVKNDTDTDDEKTPGGEKVIQKTDLKTVGGENEIQEIDVEIRELQEKLELLTERKKQLTEK